MKTIHKYAVELGDFKLMLPKHAKVLSVQMQNSQPVMWVLVDTDMPLKQAMFCCAGTGWELQPDIGYEEMPYIGTFQTGNGLVFHLFGGRTV